jgi:hypothetical protein
MKKCYINRNLWNYDVPQRPPILGSEFDTVYITDNKQNADVAKQLGWNKIIIYDKHGSVQDKFLRRRIIGKFLTVRLEDTFPVLNEYDQIFICDSNIIKHPVWYNDFVNLSTNDKCMYITHGYYKGARNTLKQEFIQSLSSSRWKHSHDNLKECYNNTYQKLIPIDILNTLPIYSAKYIGWNLKHSKYEEISKLTYSLMEKCFQGNILLSLISALYYDDIFHYKQEIFGTGKLTMHKHNS